ncbi:DNA replication and repair protein RadC [Anseongella ginsenosidimutans]|uniref:DNA replication and repair protein RadC n=1 Tax=Anseongella ginsenosidimutans TaxID=496056 RepID=A0A4R3KQ32_9SPHI|nr:DNA repair protein RadC [Anseongella ginsenosidimutans]QEC52311.1 DNA repair protein RadC [Anseongella ginsenosidimutans]TCS86874.1 DNA replication and repair protein RadC [Anseongella ginsenosidimutans]
MLTFEKRISIKAWAEEDRPREKLLQNGRHSLSEAELLAIILGSGNENESAVELSKRILQSCENKLDKLGKLSVTDLQHFHGIGPAKAVSIIAALELGRRRKETTSAADSRITASADVFKVMLPFMEDLMHEEFWMISLNRANRIISNKRISSGGLSGTVADPRIIYKSALEQLATSVIFSHNHPSGNTKPSKADIELTKKLVIAGDILEINVLDHVIVSDSGFFSFADEGMI